MILTGIRPSGRLHLGNYLGVIKPFKELEGVKQLFIADLHCRTIPSDFYNIIAQFNALGIDCAIESHHLGAIYNIYRELSFIATTGQLNRMTQFKDKVAKGDNPSLSLFAYPVLMAADIFYFGATHVLVGDDQKQHIEFARDIAEKAGYKKPEAIYSNAPRVMNLRKADEKMSKTNAFQDGVIYLDDAPEEIERKVMGATTSANYTDGTPEMNNLKIIMMVLGGNPERYTGCAAFKKDLVQLIIGELYDR